MERFRCDAAAPVVALHQTFVVRGWAAEIERPSIGRISLAVNDGVIAADIRRQRRDDVARHFGSQTLEGAGFLAIVPRGSVGIGIHELRVLVDGKPTEIPPLRLQITPTDEDSAKSDVADDTLEATFVAAHSQTKTANAAFHFEHGLPAVLRGRLNYAGKGRPIELFSVVDDYFVYPAQLDIPLENDLSLRKDTVSFLACFTTRDLEPGEHNVRLAAKFSDGTTSQTQPTGFRLDPLCVRGHHAILDSSAIARASIDVVGERSTSGGSAKRTRFSRDEIICVRGWAIDVVAADSLQAVVLRFDNGARFRMETRGLRRDIADLMHLAVADYCGFVGNVDARFLSVGNNVGRCDGIDKSGTVAYLTDAVLEIEVTD